MTCQQRTITYSGAVQGVGFRYTACRVAAGYDVTGYVRNLPDGTVECVIEGDPAELDAFQAELARQMGGHIRKQTHQSSPPTGQYGSFGVRY